MASFSILPCLLIFPIQLAASTALHAQSPQPNATVGTSSKPSSPELSVMECQGINICASWKFTNGSVGASGIGKWPTGEEATLTVTKLDQNDITITRSDLSGTKSAGLRATYTGTSQGGAVVGWYKSDFNGKTEYGPWYWIVNTPSNSPLMFTVWHSDGSAPVLFTFGSSSPGTRGKGTFSGGDATIVLDSYDGKTVVVSADTVALLGVSGSYTGHIDENGIEGTVIISDRGHHRSVTVPWRGELGDARNGRASSGSSPSGITLAQGLQGLHDFATVLGFFQPVLRYLNSTP